MEVLSQHSPIRSLLTGPHGEDDYCKLIVWLCNPWLLCL